MIKKTITTLSLVCLALGIHAESKYLTVEMKEGAKFSFLLADKPVITCQSGSLVVNKDAKTTYAFEGVKNFHFTENNEGSSGGTTKVEESYSQLLQIVWIDNETIEVQNAQPNLTISLVSINGSVLSQTTADTDGKATFSISNEAGVYVLSTGNQSFKIIRK